jgi:hypothetical protein
MKRLGNILKGRSLFWSRIGFEMDPARYDEQGKLIEFGGDYAKFAKFHKDMHRLGIKLHTSILPSGWVGEDQYNYTLTDRTLDTLFSELPEDAFYIPRVKLNAPVEWSKNHPEELFVYYGGNNDPEYIRPRVGSLEHDLLGYEAPNGYYMGKDNRPNVNGFFSNQSFASTRWMEDAKKALRSLMKHLAGKPYGKRIIGWHIAYGACGETSLWGRSSGRYGDYSRVFHNAFCEWGIEKYGSREKLLEAWGTLEMPSPEQRRNVYSSVDAFLRKRPCDVIVRDLDCYMSELNSSVAEDFCKTVKEESPEALTGIFYGYMLECHNAAYSGWLGLDHVLHSPYIDFLAAPTSYYRRKEGESGGFIAPAQSVGLHKIWVDELDIRTYLSGQQSAVPQNCSEAVVFRETAKNLAADSGFWWMDLGGGWFDSDFMHKIIRKAENTAKGIRKRKHVSSADVLILADEKTYFSHTESRELFRLYQNFYREAALSGIEIDIYRVGDLPELNLEQYKLIVLCDCPAAPNFPDDKTVLYMYLGTLPAGLSTKEIPDSPFPEGDIEFSGDFTGTFRLDPLPLPRISPVITDGIEIHARFSDRTPAVVSKGKWFYSCLPCWGWKQFRTLADKAGCRFYGQAPCIVYGDNRFTAVFSHDEPEKYKVIYQ